MSNDCPKQLHNFLSILVHIFLDTLLGLLAHMRITVKESTLRDTCFRNHEPNRVPEMSLSYLQHIPIYYTSGKYKLSIRFSLEYYTIVFHIWCMIETCSKFCQS